MRLADMPQFCDWYPYFFQGNLSIRIIPTYLTQNIEIILERAVLIFITGTYTQIQTKYLEEG